MANLCYHPVVVEECQVAIYFQVPHVAVLLAVAVAVSGNGV